MFPNPPQRMFDKHYCKDYLKKEDAKFAAELARVWDDNNFIKKVIRHSPKGKMFRWVARLPLSVIVHPEAKKYIDRDQDMHERKKGIDKLLKRFEDNPFDLRKT